MERIGVCCLPVDTQAPACMGQPTADQVAPWISRSRAWAAQASAQAGAPPPLSLLPSAPSQLNPAWRRAPSWAAAALLVPPRADAHAKFLPPLPYVSELLAAEAAGRSSGLAGRVLWALGGRALFFARGMPYPHCDGLAHRRRDLLPLTLALLVPEGEAAGAARRSRAASAAEAAAPACLQGEAEAQRSAQAALFQEVAADQRPGALRLLGYLLSHLFRWGRGAAGASQGRKGRITSLLHAGPPPGWGP